MSRTIPNSAWSGVVAGVVVCLVGLSACSSSEDPAAADVTKITVKKLKPTAPPGERPAKDMVAAVSATKSGPVDLKFDLRDRPEVGQPVDVDLALIPGPNLDRVTVKFQAEDGLELVAGAELTPLEKPAEGGVVRHTVRVIPHKDGIFSLTATVSTEAANQSGTRTFSIPIIAGQGFTEPPAGKSEVGAATASSPGADRR
jgi:hypothetical protein